MANGCAREVCPILRLVVTNDEQRSNTPARSARSKIEKRNKLQRMIKNQRRVFRGRGGPTDRRLPKHNARRRHPPRTAQGDVAFSVEDSSFPPPPPPPEPGTMDLITAPERRETNVMESIVCNFDRCDLDGTVQVVPSCAPVAQVNHASPSSPSSPISHDPSAVDPRVDAYHSEIDHLIRRIKNNQETMQLSNQLNDPDMYQKHVLDAVRNTVHEWKAIRRFYTDEFMTVENIKSDQRRIGTLVFHLVQQALQCGPLAGSKPGYTKRCGIVVSQQVLKFLEDTFESGNKGEILGLTEKQLFSIEKWKKNAHKASSK